MNRESFAPNPNVHEKDKEEGEHKGALPENTKTRNQQLQGEKLAQTDQKPRWNHASWTHAKASAVMSTLFVAKNVVEWI